MLEGDRQSYDRRFKGFVVSRMLLFYEYFFNDALVDQIGKETKMCTVVLLCRSLTTKKISLAF